MNIALALQHKLFLGLQRLWSAHTRGAGVQERHAQPMAVVHGRTERRVTPLRAACQPKRMVVADSGAHHPKPMPLRVVRVIDQDQPRSSTGRMVISGRMADVCAELDRLVALQAAAPNR